MLKDVFPKQRSCLKCPNDIHHQQVSKRAPKPKNYILREYKTAEYKIKSTLPFKRTLKKVYKNRYAIMVKGQLPKS